MHDKFRVQRLGFRVSFGFLGSVFKGLGFALGLGLRVSFLQATRFSRFFRSLGHNIAEGLLEAFKLRIHSCKHPETINDPYRRDRRDPPKGTSKDSGFRVTF